MTNLLAGVWLAALRPIDKGEVVTTNGETGTVDAIRMMATEILSFDNKFITIPNKLVWGSVIVNYTRMPTRRVDVNVGKLWDRPGQSPTDCDGYDEETLVSSG